MNLAELKSKRQQFLVVLYEMADGDADRGVNTKELGERLGIDYDHEAPRIARYWRGQEMVDWGSFDRIFLTARGQSKAEELIEANEQAISKVSDETMNCPQCRHATRTTARFCEKCGTN